MKLQVDLAKCTKSGECYYNHPELFKQDPEGYPILLIEELVTEDQKLEAEQALAACPAEERPISIVP